MSEKIVQLNEEVIKGQLKELVRGSVEETLNELLEAEAEKLTQAARYERNEQRQGYRSGHYNRNLTTTSGDVTLKVPKLKGISFETAIIERYRRRESSVEEALIEMYLAGVSVRRVEDITEALWGSKVSPSTISELNKKAYVHIEDWRNRPLQGGRYPDVSRFGTQVINGIGFLGAGTIIVTGKQEVKGLTTAAGLWASACMGLAIGAGFYECVLLGFLLILLTNRLLPFVEDAIIESARNMNIYVEFQTLDDLGDIIGRIKSQWAQIYEVDLDRGREERSKNPSAVFSIRLPGRHYHVRVLAAISELESVYTIDEI